MDDPAYNLRYKQTLSIKPINFYIHAIPRTDKARIVATPSSSLLRDPTVAATPLSPVSPSSGGAKTPLCVLYGSNMGTSESFAQRIASDASIHGKKRVSVEANLPLASLRVSSFYRNS